jgi:hypothetical protein
MEIEAGINPLQMRVLKRSHLTFHHQHRPVSRDKPQVALIQQMAQFQAELLLDRQAYRTEIRV